MDDLESTGETTAHDDLKEQLFHTTVREQTVNWVPSAVVGEKFATFFCDDWSDKQKHTIDVNTKDD